MDKGTFREAQEWDRGRRIKGGSGRSRGRETLLKEQKLPDREGVRRTVAKERPALSPSPPRPLLCCAPAPGQLTSEGKLAPVGFTAKVSSPGASAPSLQPCYLCLLSPRRLSTLQSLKQGKASPSPRQTRVAHAQARNR